MDTKQLQRVMKLLEKLNDSLAHRLFCQCQTCVEYEIVRIILEVEMARLIDLEEGKTIFNWERKQQQGDL